VSLTPGVIGFAERVPLPDFVIRAAIHQLCSRTAARLAAGDAASDAEFAREMAARAVAEHTEAANAQHYEVPAAFFARVLGPNRKYSSCFYRAPASTLQEAEEEALRQSVDHADLADGQSILELGCGWGSLSLWMARQFPNSKVVAVSNSHSQRMHVQGEGAARGLTNLSVVTADMNSFNPGQQFDRIVSVEMFEHMMNWRELFGKGEILARAAGPFVHAYLYPSCRHLSIRSQRQSGLDRTALLHRRGDAEPSSDPAICRSVRGREGVALERRALPAHRDGLARQFRCPS
jgi:cyclopropane-fatty-acyl-phospholipid synthase